MGLDMHLFKMRKPEKTSEDLSKMSIDELSEKGYTAFFKDELPDGFDLIRHLATKAEVNVQYINMEKIRKDYGIPDGSRVIGESYSSENIGYTFRLPKTESCDSKHIDIPTDRVKAEYVFTKKTEAFCVSCEEAAYWRKNYKLQDAFYAASDVPIQNCGFYPMTDAMWDVLKKHDKETYNRLAHYRDDDSCVITYHEWY